MRARAKNSPFRKNRDDFQRTCTHIRYVRPVGADGRPCREGRGSGWKIAEKGVGGGAVEIRAGKVGRAVRRDILVAILTVVFR